MSEPNIVASLLEWFSFFYIMALVLAFITLFAVSSWMTVRFKRTTPSQQLIPDNPIQMPPVSILIPVYNEAKVLIDSLEMLFNLDYPEFELVVVNDGSQDNTLQVLIDYYALRPISTAHPGWVQSGPVVAAYRSPWRTNLVVIDKAHGRKADTLNAAINFSQYPIYCCVDADSVIRRDGLRRGIQPFLNDPHVVGVGCGLRVLQESTLEATPGDCDNPEDSIKGTIRLGSLRQWLAGFQSLEYLQAFQMARMAWTAVNASPLISGAFAMYKKEVVIQAGGYRSGCIGDDSDMTLRIHQYLSLINPQPYKLAYVPDPLCWTQVPTDLKSLFHQRARWQRGLADGILYRPKLFLTPRHAALGFMAIPFSILFEMLSPLLELFGLLVLGVGALTGFVNPHNYAVALFFILGFWLLLSSTSILMDQLTYQTYPHPSDVLKLMILAVLKPFGYNQFTLAARVYGILQQITRRKRRHGPMARQPFSTVPFNAQRKPQAHKGAGVATG